MPSSAPLGSRRVLSPRALAARSRLSPRVPTARSRRALAARSCRTLSSRAGRAPARPAHSHAPFVHAVRAEFRAAGQPASPRSARCRKEQHSDRFAARASTGRSTSVHDHASCKMSELPVSRARRGGCATGRSMLNLAVARAPRRGRTSCRVLERRCASAICARRTPFRTPADDELPALASAACAPCARRLTTYLAPQIEIVYELALPPPTTSRPAGDPHPRGSKPFSSHCEPLYDGTVVETQMIANIKSQVEQRGLVRQLCVVDVLGNLVMFGAPSTCSSCRSARAPAATGPTLATSSTTTTWKQEWRSRWQRACSYHSLRVAQRAGRLWHALARARRR